MVFWLAIIVAVILVVLLALQLLFPLPSRKGIATGKALPPASDGPIHDQLAPAIAAHPGKSGVIAVPEGHDALASRLALIHYAHTSIDVQYYIWHDDVSGMLVLGALYEAAQRGVRVRILLDDNGITGLDQMIASLSEVPGIEIRLFNPSTVRRPKMLGFAFDFFRMNRRMHNKALIVDGLAAVVGGRNIGDEYFVIGNESFFLDLDAIALGPVVAQTSAIFDAYWNCRSVYPAPMIIRGLKADIPAFVTHYEKAKASEVTQALIAQYQVSADDMLAQRLEPEWTDVAVYADDPIKGEGLAKKDALIVHHLDAILNQARVGIDIVSAYFIPGRSGTNMLKHWASEKVTIRILTNAFSTTDVKVVHSGYIKYRRALLKAGIQLFELRAGQNFSAHKPSKRGGSSSASLHAKTFAIDGRQIFIGSFNFDPRSAHLNCEMGYLIDSPSLSQQMINGFDQQIRMLSDIPTLTPEGKLVWVQNHQDGAPTISQDEPGTTRMDRIIMRLFALLPIERWL